MSIGAQTLRGLRAREARASKCRAVLHHVAGCPQAAPGRGGSREITAVEIAVRDTARQKCWVSADQWPKSNGR